MKGYSNKCGDYEIEVYHEGSGGKITRHYNDMVSKSFSIHGMDTQQSLEDLKYLISQAIKHGFN